ncbi:MAG: hypothetical protein KBA53_08585 [Thermoclostridium sp.]|nr:hypothetical protein [Thermoclostridium sp.]
MKKTIPVILLLFTALFWEIILKDEFSYVLIWWVIILILGLMAFPLSATVFSSFTDKGYLFSKGLGIAISSYALWLLSTLKIFKIDGLGCWSVVLGCGVIIFFAFYKKARLSLSGFRQGDALSWILIGESIFLFSLSFWTYLRGFNARLEGLEKFMDYGFINSILRSGFAPPKDMWFAGKSINYYYFGQYVSAFINRLSGIKTEIAYNLMMAALFAFSMALCFSIVSNLLKGQKLKNGSAIFGGLVGATLVSLGGNLHSFIYGTLSKYTTEGKAYWFPDATRYIGYNPETSDKTIHEFPVYSFVVSDLHAHVINMIFVLTLLGVLIAIFRKLQFRAESGWQAKNFIDAVFFPELLVPGFLIGIFQMSNFWDFPIYLTVTLFTLLCAGIRQHGFTLKMLQTAILRFIIVVASSLAFAYPFNMTFDKIATGIRLSKDHSYIYQLLVLWGYQLVIAAIFFVMILFTEQNLIWRRAKNKEREKIRKELTFLARIRNVLERFSIEDVFTVILFVSAIGLVIIPELVYVEDIYTGEHKRANTMFKLTYQSFIMFGLGCGYVFIRIWQMAEKGWKRTASIALTIIMVLLPMIYPIKYAIPSWYREMKPELYEGLDGLAFLQREYPDDYALIQWMRENIEGQPTVLEANGDSYTYYGRVSMATGFPTIQGWYVHEWLWRDDYHVVQERVDDVQVIYESDDLDQTVELLKKYAVEYIVIGDLEWKKFTQLQQAKLLSLGEVVFELPTIRLIKLNTPANEAKSSCFDGLPDTCEAIATVASFP